MLITLLRGPRAVARSVLRAAVAAAVCIVVHATVGVGASAQTAGTREASLRDATWGADMIQRSHVVIPSGTRFPVSRKLSVNVDKSMFVELPVDLQSVLVSNPEIVDAVVQSNRMIYLLGKDSGEANIFLIGPDGQKLAFFEVTVSRDLTSLNDTLARLIPGSKIRGEMVADNVVLTGSVINPIDADRAVDLAQRFVKKKDGVTNMISVAAKEQVLLKIQVAEMQRDAIRRLGVSYPGIALKGGNISFTQVIQNAFPASGTAVGAAASVLGPNGLPIPGAIPFAPTSGLAAQPTWQSGSNQITALIEALERSGMIKTLAEPNLTAISGEQAKFLAGGEFPIPVAQEQGRISVAWKPFGVGVNFRPIVMADGRISLNIAAEVSELSSDSAFTAGGITIASLKVRRAETTLEMPSGGTLAMAGLLTDDTRQNIDGVPGLKNLPVLGALFRSTDFRRRESELVILVTPYLVSHAPKREFARPDGGFAPSHSLRELFLGQLHRLYPSARETSVKDGNVGFIISYPDPGVKG
jgi:pilus assembly protein CpaC